MKSVATLLQHAWDSHGRAGNGVRTPLLPDISGPRATAFTSLPLCLMSKLSSASSPSLLPPPLRAPPLIASPMVPRRGDVETAVKLINWLADARTPPKTIRHQRHGNNLWTPGWTFKMHMLFIHLIKLLIIDPSFLGSDIKDCISMFLLAINMLRCSLINELQIH